MIQTLSYATKDENNNYHHPAVSHSRMNHSNSTSNPTLSESGTITPLASKSPIDQLISNLKNNPNYLKETSLSKLIGFYRIGSEIGTGNFSQVKLGLHLLTKDKVAIKILDKTKLDDKTQRLLLREITSMEKLHHPNIIRLYEVIHRPTRLYICMEWAPEGELYTRIVDHGKLNEIESRYIFSQIISAVNHMHKNNICHRDIKAENIFFSNLSPYMVKVGDFGFSINATTSQRLNTYCGSPPYAAPELFRDDSYVGIYVDIWALGILLYFMVTSTMPFRADTVSKLKRMILNGDYTIPSFISDSCQLLIKGILKPVPIDRFNIKEITESAWLDGEEFTSDLEPYQISNNIEKSPVKREEIRAKENLERLGITRDILICCNLAVTPDQSHPQKDYSFNMNTSNSNPNIVDKNINLLPIPILPNNSVSYHSALLINQAKNINIELKQSINGTYRIIFHKIQKELRREFSSDQMSKHNNTRYLSSSSNTNTNTTVSTKQSITGYIYDYNKNNDSNNNNNTSNTNDTDSYYDNNSNEFDPNTNNNSSSNKSVKKNSLINDSPTANKNLFVKLNTNTTEMNKNIFVNQSSKPLVNSRPSLPMPPPHQSKTYENDEKGKEQYANRIPFYNNQNNKNKDSWNQNRRSSFQDNHFSKNNKPSNNYYGNNDKHQSSKFCSIL